MRIVFHKAIALAIALILGLGIYLPGCGDKKTTAPVEQMGYYVYFGDQGELNIFYRYHTGTMMLDSFYLPYNSLLDGFGISPDGKTMYLHPDDGIVEVSLDSLVVVAEHPIYLPKGGPTGNGHEVIISPDGRYLALLNRYLHLVDLTDFSVIYTDTTHYAGHGWFSQDSKSFFCSIPSNYYALEIILADVPEIRYHAFENAAVWRIKTSTKERLWFLYLGIGGGVFLFQTYDVEKDSIIFEKALNPGAGDMEVTPNGRYVIYTQPGDWGYGCPPTMTFTIFDVLANRIDREVLAYFDSLQAVFAVDQLVITPDGRHLIGLGRNTGHLMDYDLWTHEFRKIVDFQGPVLRWVHSLTCQSRR